MKDSAWGIAIVTVYVYVVTTLTELGANYYFSIPASYVEVSLRANTVFLYSLYSALVVPIFQHIFEQKWWILLGTAICVGFAIRYREELKSGPFVTYLRGVVTVTAIIVLLVAPFVGNHASRTATTFLVPEKGCPSLPPNSLYVIPVIENGAGVLAEYRIVSTSNQLTGKLYVKNLSDLNCNLEYAFNVGPLTY